MSMLTLKTKASHWRSRLLAGLAGLRRDPGPMALFPAYRTPPGLIRSSICSQRQLESDVFQRWGGAFRERPGHLHRKIWEFCFIAQALHERGMLQTGRTGLGFAVGQEPLTATFASMGCDVLATDLEFEKAELGEWTKTHQHAASLDHLNLRGICPPAQLLERVRFRYVDIRSIPDDLGAFDFLWSACSLEHLGSLALGETFIWKSLELLKPGGVAVYTTEYNLQSNTATVADGPSVIYRQRDIRRIAYDLSAAGYEIDVDYTLGSDWGDRHVESPPYRHDVHLRLFVKGFETTSIGLIVMKPSA